MESNFRWVVELPVRKRATSSWRKATGWGESRFTVVCMEKDMQVAIIMVALLTQKNVTMAPCT